MATIIAIILAVIVDRYIKVMPGGQVLERARSTAWLNLYLNKCITFLEKISIKQNYLVVLSCVLPICIALFIVKLLFGMLLGEKLGQFLFVTLTLFYFLGNRQVEDQESVFVTVHETSFGVMFWFAILGFSGAFLYWFLVVAKQMPIIVDNINAHIRQALVSLHALAAWLPARVSGFIYALVGNFSPAYKCWINCVKDPKLPSSRVLQECGSAAVDSSTVGDDVRLVNNAFVAWVILIIIFVAIR
ncbi:MAG TPA: regulatory signaling modulator protein AmpE [Gammaproteobacteria bacterium]|nr:regulatory signaling modulator protein AmpE [Gammaproteobacteria bacterium]